MIDFKIEKQGTNILEDIMFMTNNDPGIICSNQPIYGIFNTYRYEEVYKHILYEYNNIYLMDYFDQNVINLDDIINLDDLGKNIIIRGTKKETPLFDFFSNEIINYLKDKYPEYYL